MTTFDNKRKESAIRCVEFAEDGAAGASVFHVKDRGHSAEVKDWLTHKAGMQLIGEVDSGTGTVFFANGKTQKETLDALAARGDDFAQHVDPKKFNPWKWRGITSIVGQSLQLTSAFLAVPKEGATPASIRNDRLAIGGFAVLNLMANITNITFGSQKKEDPHQLRVLKEQFNKHYGSYMEPGSGPIPTEENRFALRPEHEQKKTNGQKFYSVCQKYSVSGGEIGLRLFGASQLSFPLLPLNKWPEATTKIASGSFKGALDTVKNTNPVTFRDGLITLVGKFVSLASKEPDPFNPQPASLLDKIREKVTFRASSVIEAVAAGDMMVDRFKNQKVKVFDRIHPDYFGGVGNLVFIGGYAIRLFAPYGSLEVNTKELNAHITDSLARMPREKLPQLLAEISVDLNRHFGAKAKSVSEIYTELATDLEKHHGISVMPYCQPGAEGKVFANESLKKSPRSEAMPHAASHQDRVLAEPAATLGLS